MYPWLSLLPAYTKEIAASQFLKSNTASTLTFGEPNPSLVANVVARVLLSGPGNDRTPEKAGRQPCSSVLPFPRGSP